MSVSNKTRNIDVNRPGISLQGLKPGGLNSQSIATEPDRY